ncbi:MULTISPECIES: TetR/AcrR family transcriptional regulator [unclassified Myxococcus]|uniref:TetR/AcrR family transcriptional regulator n=1 Tax=unclassified Myxococcus TaxID=2648731 RepID=UPI00157AFC9F|nr:MULTISPECIES: TetR/AcrR family transcriptional regulator [unclassified Myxococcus]NTX02956.1 TetR family transcriptional regulator [Myxococcus sp. CA040A]NTX11374.1 TetR family transcriptional regulator [Myxococcus sp. CA056]
MSSDPRIAILKAAGEVFARFGFKKASVEDIAKRAGVGKGSIYLHFESKEALFEAIVRQSHEMSLAELKASVQRATTPEAQVRAYIRCKLEQSVRKPDGERLEMATLFELGTQVMHLVPQMQDADAAILARVFEDGVAGGVFTVSAPQLAARGFVELITMLVPKLMTQETSPLTLEALDASFELFIRGLSAPPGPTPPTR